MVRVGKGVGLLLILGLLLGACGHLATKPSASGPLTYTGQKRCMPGRESGLPDGEVCAFVYETVADCDFILAMPAGESPLTSHQSVFGFICKEKSR
jgi:hypothetical protein